VEITEILIGEGKNHKTLLMGNESVNEPHDLVEVGFTWLKEQVLDINYNVKLLMANLKNKMGIF